MEGIKSAFLTYIYKRIRFRAFEYFVRNEAKNFVEVSLLFPLFSFSSFIPFVYRDEFVSDSVVFLLSR